MTSYSGILFEFIEPMLQGIESEEALLEKGKFGISKTLYIESAPADIIGENNI